jgi:hypothetical protein
MRETIIVLLFLLWASAANAQNGSSCPAGLIGVTLAHPADNSAPAQFCVASVVPATVQGEKPTCTDDFVLVKIIGSQTGFACAAKSAIPTNLATHVNSSTPAVPPSASITSSEAAAPLQNALTDQDVISGKVSCNDPRVFNDTHSYARLEKIAPQVSRKGANFIMCVALRLIKGNKVTLPVGFGHTWGVLPVHNDQINSMMQTLPNGLMVVEAFDSMARFLNYDPDEEAFVIGHEIGHVQDANHCAFLHGQASRSILFPVLAQKHAQQQCEEDADFYGLQYMWGASFNPFAAGALMGRLEMYQPDQTRGMASMLNNFLSDHPISSERTAKLRNEMIQLCSKPGTVCQNR